MSRDHLTFALWTLGILGAAVAVILYQHATHTNILMSLLGGVAAAQVAPQSMDAAAVQMAVTGTIAADPIQSGASSRASGQWTPLGPRQGVSIMAYNPPQTFQ